MLFAKEQGQLQGDVINVKGHMDNITAEINTLDYDQIKKFNEALDQAESSQNTIGRFKATPAAFPLAVPILWGVGASFVTYLFGKAAVETYEIIQKSKDPLGFPTHPNKPIIFTTPADPITPPKIPGFLIPEPLSEESDGFRPHPNANKPTIFTTPGEVVRNTLFFSRVFSKKENNNIDLPDKSSNWIKLKGSQGWKNKEDGSIWRKDKLHKDHWDVMDSKENKIKEVDFFGKQIWPNGPKNKQKFPKNKT